MIKILAFGNSLIAGYGLPKRTSFADQLQNRLNTQGIDTWVINAGLSGDTSIGGCYRIDEHLKTSPDLVIVEFGTNDLLLGYDPDEILENLELIIQKCLSKGSEVLLAGIRIPIRLPQDYAERFYAIYPELAHKYQIALYPDFLAGIGSNQEMSLADGLHPNVRGVAFMVDNFLPYLMNIVI